MESITSYNGVSLSDAQKSTLQKDLDLIDAITAQIASLNDAYAFEENKVNQAKNQLDNYCNTLKGSGRSNCIATYNSQWDLARSNQANFLNSINIKKEALKGAEHNYNQDLDAIQNEIKFQIQTSLANSQSQTQAAQNQITLNQNDPRVLLIKAKADAEQKAKALELQATLDKQKREAQTKMFGFVAITLAVIAIGYFSLKRLGVI